MRRVQLVLLCEDAQHEAFCRRFLNAVGWETRALRVERAPHGRGDAVQFVVGRFPVELQARRSRFAAGALVVMVDGDNEGVADRIHRLGASCDDAGVGRRTDAEAVAIFVPTRRIETWLAYLDGQTVDESLEYPRLERERECQRHVDGLVEMCRSGHLREPVPPSLRAACDEYNSRLLPLAAQE